MADTQSSACSAVALTEDNLANTVDRSSDSWNLMVEAREPRMRRMGEDMSTGRLVVEPHSLLVTASFSVGVASAISGYAVDLSRAAVVMRRRNDATTRHAFVEVEEGVFVMLMCLCTGSADVRMDSRVLG